MIRWTALALLILLVSCASPSETEPETVIYPESRRAEQVDMLHGVAIPDPYRWLEDLDSDATRDWVRLQNELTFGYLGAIPERAAIRERLEALWNYPKISPPFHRGGRRFRFRNDGLQNHAVLYWSEGDGPERSLLDPNAMSADGSVSLAGLEVSDDGRFCAYALSKGGSDWNVWQVKDVTTGEDGPDRLEWVKFSGVSWVPDGSGFYYSRFPKPESGQEREQANYNQKLFFHRRGTPQAQDTLVYERPDQPEWGFDGNVTDDGQFLIIRSWVGTDSRNRLLYQDLARGGGVQPLVMEFDGAYDFVGNLGRTFFVRTDLDAPRGRVIAIDVDRPERAAWREIIAQQDDVLDSVRMVGGQFIAFQMHDAHHRGTRWSFDGAFLGDVPLPGIGSVEQVTGRPRDRRFYFGFNTFIEPSSVWSYDVDSGHVALDTRPTLPFDPSRFTTSQVRYTSRDGTSVPMFLVHRKDVTPNGERPVYLYGYGGFDISLTPAFSPSILTWLEMGGVFAQPSLRGGGEFGDSWHKAGMLDRKQNVFDDFIAAGEWLVAQGWTQPSRLAIGGGSNGGLLVGACMLQRPDLFGACLPAVGVMDMLRFHKFTIGWAWVPEYGSPDDPEQFRTLLTYSPLHNLKPGTAYPATLITTADHDDRVVPAHSFKFAAALQASTKGPDPCLIRIETMAGHGAGVPTSKRIEEAADKWAFLVRQFGMVIP